MAKLHRVNDELVAFHCPACDNAHQVRVAGLRPYCWTWNGNMYAPTFYPSVKVTWNGLVDGQEVTKICHSFITDGMIVFETDSTHQYAGQTLPLPEWKEGCE